MNPFGKSASYTARIYYDPGKITFAEGESLKFTCSIYSEIPVSRFRFRLWRATSRVAETFNWVDQTGWITWPMPPLRFDQVGNVSLQVDTAISDAKGVVLPETKLSHWLGDFYVHDRITRLPSLVRDCSGVLWAISDRSSQISALSLVTEALALALMRLAGEDPAPLRLKVSGNTFTAPDFGFVFDPARKLLTIAHHGISIDVGRYQIYTRYIQALRSITKDTTIRSTYNLIAIGSIYYGYHLANPGFGEHFALLDHNLTCNTASLLLLQLLQRSEEKASFISLNHTHGAHAVVSLDGYGTGVILDPSEGIMYSGSPSQVASADYTPVRIVLPRYSGVGLDVPKMLQAGAAHFSASSLVPDSLIALAVQ